MAKSDILVRWKADTSNYDANIAKARRQLDGFAKDNLSAGGALKQLTQSLVGTATKFASLAAAGKLAMETIKGAFNATERSADALASTQMQLNSVVDSFFRTLNDGSFTTFLSGLSDVATRAMEAYEAMDELSSFAVRYNPKNRADMQRIDKLLKEARALQAKGDKAGAAAKTDEATAIANQARANTLAYGEKEYNAGVSTLRNLLGGTGVTYTNKQLEWYSDPANWDRINKKAREYEAIQAKIKKLQQGNITATSYDTNTRSSNRAEIAMLEASITPEQRRAYNYLNTRDTAGTENGDMFIKATEQIYGKQMAEYAADAIQARIDRANAVATKTTGGGSGGGRGSSGFTSSIKEPAMLAAAFEGTVPSIQELRQQLAAFKAAADNATTAFDRINAESGMEQTEKQIAAQPLALKAGIDINTAMEVQEQWDGGLRQQIEDALNADAIRLKASLDIDPDKLKEVSTDAKKMGANWQAAGQAIQAVGNAMSAIEDPAAKVAGTIAEAIASIALGAGQAIASHGGRMENGGPWAWIAFAAAATATMIATITSVRKATSHADGGIIPGNNLSGDNRLAWVNSGEVVLNAAQSDTLAARLQGSYNDYQPRNSFISGEQIVTVVNAYGRRTGRGEILR